MKNWSLLLLKIDRNFFKFNTNTLWPVGSNPDLNPKQSEKFGFESEKNTFVEYEKTEIGTVPIYVNKFSFSAGAAKE
jgi:hypothetical protein